MLYLFVIKYMLNVFCLFCSVQSSIEGKKLKHWKVKEWTRVVLQEG